MTYEACWACHGSGFEPCWETDVDGNMYRSSCTCMKCGGTGNELFMTGEDQCSAG